MPSASRRRKSAKKKKQTTIISLCPPTFQLRGLADLKTNQESVVEINSLTAQNHLLDRHSVVQAEEGEEEGEPEEKGCDSSSAVESISPPNHKQMDGFENHKLEETQKEEEFISEDGIVIESITDGKEAHDDDQWSSKVVVSEELEEAKVVLESVIETEPCIDSDNPVVSLSEELAQIAQEPVVENSGASDDVEIEDTVIDGSEPLLDDHESNGVCHAVMDLVSEGIDSIPVENGISPIETDSVPKGIENEYNGVSSVSKGIVETMLPVSNENTGDSSRGADVVFVAKENVANIMLQPADVSSDDGGEDCNMYQLPKSTENQPFIAVIPRPLQRTSWRGCCGLFEVVKRSNQ